MTDEIDGETPLVDETDSAVDPIKQQRKRRRVARAEEEKSAFWRTVFSGPLGRAEMWAILQAAHTFEERFACGPNGFPCPESTWFEAGIQSFGYRLFLSWLKLDPEGVKKMLEEHEPRMAKAKR